MIKLMEKVIRNQGLYHGEKSLQFLKYSTPSSGKRRDDKVVFFVFKGRDRKPFLCIKTVRDYKARESVLRNFHNLEMLKRLTDDTRYKNLFAEPLYLHDDGEHIFSIESVCTGKKKKFDESRLQKVVDIYTAFQVHILKGGYDSIGKLKDYAQVIVMRSGLLPADQLEITKSLDHLPLGDIHLPRIIQHSDITADNILFSRKGVAIVDCDFIGKVDLPGFDLFGLFYRYDRRRLVELCHKYLPKYFDSIGASVEADQYRGLLFIYYFIERTLRKPYNVSTISAKEIIEDFRKLI